jgi:hypothetical protein
MQMRRIFTIGPDDAPLWVRLYVQPIGDQWSAMIVADGAAPPGPGELKGLTFFEATVEGAEAQAKAYLALSEPQN